MEKIALSLVGPIVSPIFSKLQNAALSYFGGDITEKELQQLQTTILPKIRAVLLVAEAKNVEVLQPYLVKLKEAAYEAEDVLDMYEYQRLKAQVSSTHKYFKTFKKKAKAVLAPFSLKTELKNTMEKLIKIADGIDQFVPLYSNFTNQDPMNRQQQQHPASVSSPSSPVIGRDLQRDSIVNKLISAANEPSTSSGSRIQVLAIYGIGGAGKTTLAQSINKDPRVVKHFDTKMWVHVSRIFDAHAITRQIIESITEGDCSRVESLDVLQSKLKKLLLESKKFLLVLDDVWCLDKERWDQMLIPFNEVGEMGSRILITCRAEEVTSKLGVHLSFPLAELKHNDYWSIFKHYSFDDAKKDITDPQLSELASKIVKKLSKSPLAARMVGSSLRGKEVGYWKQTLQRGDMLKDTLGALYWSFEMLPPCLQRCFALCSLYPKGYYFENVEEELVRLWIAQGFIEVPSSSTVTLEDEAMSYFNELLCKSFFQKKFYLYEMHDLLHDLAENVSKDYCFRIEGDRQCIPENVMHLSVVGYKNISSHLPDIFKLVNLRTLIIVSSSSTRSQDDISGFIQQVFMKFKKLRMLHFGGGYHDKVIKLDKSVGGLKHLRYLQVRRVEELPESLGKLYHLQFLVIKISIKKQFGIGQLKNLQQLRGTLWIDGLENVKDKAEASEASLKEKEHVDRLELHWERRSSERDGSMDAEVLEGLQPHPNLGALKLDGYNGVRLPIDLERLPSLEIVDCDNLQQIPSLPSMLGRLVIERCPNLSELPLLPLGLRVLTVHGCPKLVQLQLPVSSRIEELDLEDCGGVETMLSNMSENGSSSSSGSSSSIQGVGFVVLRRLCIVRCSSIHYGGENDMLLMSTSLTDLTLTELPWLTSLLLGPNLTALKDVRIENCENLRSIGNSLVYSSSLESLHIVGSTKDDKPFTAEEEELFQHHLTSLTRLWFESCEGLPSLPANLENLSSLKHLYISDCPKIESLPNLPASLERVYIRRCPKIESLPNLPASLEQVHISGCHPRLKEKYGNDHSLPRGIKFTWY